MFYLILLALMAGIYIGAWKATQKLAELVQYDALLGAPLMTGAGGEPVYGPWMYPIWYFRFHEHIPDLFRQTYPVFFISIAISFAVAILVKVLLDSKGNLSDNYGSAKWAEPADVVRMDLLSDKHGVLVGLYDPPFKRAFRRLVTGLDHFKQKKIANARQTYERTAQEKWEALNTRYYDLKDRQEIERDPDVIEALGREMESVKAKRDAVVRDYDPKMNPFTVNPWVKLHKKLYGVYMGMSHTYLRDNTNKHLAVIAPTRSGKGVGLIIPTLLGGWSSSCIVNDIKSENWAVTSGYRKRMGQTCIKFEPTSSDGSTARWNPLDEIPVGTENEESMATNIAHVIADYEGKGKLDHWGSNAELVIMTVILHLCYAHYAEPDKYPTKPTFGTVANFLKANTITELVEVEKKDENGNVVMGEDGKPVMVEEEQESTVGFVDTCNSLADTYEHVPARGIWIEYWDNKKGEYVKGHWDSVNKCVDTTRPFTQDDLHALYPSYKVAYDTNPAAHPLIFNNFREIGAKPEAECGSIVSTANTALKEYLDPVLAYNTSVSDFCIDDVMNYERPVSLYLVTPPSDLLRLAPIFRLFFEMMVRHHAKEMGFENARPVDKYKHKCLFLMDEFSSLGNLQSFAATLSYIAGYGMKAFLINQGLPQINNIYGKDNQILMNCHLQIVYAPNDNDTAKYAADMVGKRTVRTVSYSEKGSSFIKTRDRTLGETGRELLSADEFKRLDDQEVIVASGFPPVKTDKIKYYEDNFFRKKLVPPPDVSDIIRPTTLPGHAYPRRDAAIMRSLDARRNKGRKMDTDRFDFDRRPLEIAENRNDVFDFQPAWKNLSWTEKAIQYEEEKENEMRPSDMEDVESQAAGWDAEFLADEISDEDMERMENDPDEQERLAAIAVERAKEENKEETIDKSKILEADERIRGYREFQARRMKEAKEKTGGMI
jgi:type IV secretion system protein VirD4